MGWWDGRLCSGDRTSAPWSCVCKARGKGMMSWEVLCERKAGRLHDLLGGCDGCDAAAGGGGDAIGIEVVWITILSYTSLVRYTLYARANNLPPLMT